MGAHAATAGAAALCGETLLAPADREAEEALIGAVLTTATRLDMVFLDNG